MKPDPMPASESLPPRVLLEHATSLRRLALALVRDADAADDVVQETWVRALESPPSRLEALGGWLRTVLTHIVANRHRAEARRSSREHDAARSAIAPDTGARERTLRTVVEAVLALDEPLRTVVMLRHFEGLAPREIAERLRVPPTVVYNRLQRAHARLRAKLEREDRSWVSALALLAGANERHVLLKTAGVSGGALIMGLKTQVSLVAAAALLVAGFYVWRTASNASASVAPDAASVQPVLEAARDDGAARAAAPAATDERSAVAADTREPAAPRPLPPYEYALEFSLTDADDAPLAGASVFIAPQLHPLDLAGETDGEGRLVVRWRAFADSMDVVVAASTDGRVPAELRLVHARAASEQHVAMRAGSRGWYVRLGRVLGDDALATKLTAIDMSTSSELSGAAWLGGLDQFGSGSDAPAMHMCDDGFGYFVDPWMARCVAGDPAPTPAISRVALDMFETRVRFAAKLELAEVLVMGSQAKAPHFTLEGQVFGAGDKPLGQVLVRVRREGAHQWESARSDDEGNYLFKELSLEGEGGAAYDLVAGDGDNGLAHTTIVGSDGAALRFDPRLERGRELLGRLLDADGQLLANWSIELLREDGLAPWIDYTTTDDAGNFRIPSLPGGGFTLLARPADANGAVPLVVARNAWPADERQEFKLAIEAFGGLHVELVDERDEPVAGGEVRVWRNDVERGQVLDSHSTVNAFANDSLFPGAYRVEVGAPARGWTVVDQVFVKAGETLDLGRIRCATPAHLEPTAIAAPSDAPLHALFLHRGAQVESLSNALEWKGPCAIEMPAGEYEHTAVFGELARTDKLTLRAGETRALEVSVSKARASVPSALNEFRAPR